MGWGCQWLGTTVSLAEWSKALRSGRSPLLWAWVRISQLTNSFFLSIVCACCSILAANQIYIKCLTQPDKDSRVAQWKRAGPITQRSVDRNYALLKPNSFLLFCSLFFISDVNRDHKCVPAPQHDPLAQRIARWTSNPKVLGSIPRWVEKWYFDFVHPQVYYAVRMAEWSKAPDSRCTPCFAIQSKLVRILVLDEGMGSNPISDKNLFFNVQK